MALGISLCAGASATGRRFGCAERLLTKRPVWRLEQFSGTVDFPKGPCAQRVYTLACKLSLYIGTLGPKFILFGHMGFVS